MQVCTCCKRASNLKFNPIKKISTSKLNGICFDSSIVGSIHLP